MRVFVTGATGFIGSAVDIEEVIGRRLNVPVASISAQETTAHFGPLGSFWAIDNPTSITLTRERLGWTPAHPELLSDLDDPRYLQ